VVVVIAGGVGGGDVGVGLVASGFLLRRGGLYKA
jgi:hypothetical protein